MPFVQRVVEPKFVCRRRVRPTGDIEDELESVVNVALSGALRQLASIARHADALFMDLRTELDAVRDRTKALRSRMDTLAIKAEAFNPRTVAVPEGDLSVFSQKKDHFVATREVSTNLFTSESRTPAVQQLYDAAALASAAAAAAAAEAVAAAASANTLADGQCPSFSDEPSSVAMSSRTLQTTTATTCGDSTWSSAAASRILARASKRLRNFDIETRTPASVSQLRRWTSTEALGSLTVPLGAPTIQRQRLTMPPDADIQSEVLPSAEEDPLDHRLPSPEEQVNAVAMRFQPEVVAVDVSGRTFDRMALFRRSLTHVNCPPEDDEGGTKVKRRSKGKKGKRRRRRNTIAGTGDKELMEALDGSGPSSAADHAVTSGDAESPDLPDPEITSIGMSSSTSSARAAMDKKSHFENIRQWTRSKLRGSMAAVTRARSAGREPSSDDPTDKNFYEVIRRRDRASTSLPISTLSGAMSMAVKLRQGAARKAGLAGSSSRASSGKGPGSADAALNSSSGNWSGSSSARASLESEETASQQQHPPQSVAKVLPSAPSLSTAPPSTTTSCSAAASSASSTASSSGGSSATNSLGRRDSTSTPSVTGHHRRRHDSRHGPISSSSSVPNSSSTTRAMSTSSEGTLTPDLVTVPFADDGETSSVYSCDTEGYYTSFHMDSGLKTLREEEAATVAAFIANGGLGIIGNDDSLMVQTTNSSSAIAENEYELFGKGSTSTTTSSAGTVCTTLMVRDRPAVPPRQSSLDSEHRQPSSRSASSFDLDTISTTITKAVVHAIPNDDTEDVDSGHNTTSSSSASTSPSSSPVDPNPSESDHKEKSPCRTEISSGNVKRNDKKWGNGWGECDFEFSESDLEGVERIERIRVKTTINSSRIPSMCVITPPQSDDEGGCGKISYPVYNTLPRSPSKKHEIIPDPISLATSATGVKSGGSLDNISRVVVAPITGSTKVQVINVNSTGYASVKTIEGDAGTERITQTNAANRENKVPQETKVEEGIAATESSKSGRNLPPPIRAPLTRPFNIMGMVKGVLSSAAGAVKSHNPVKSGETSVDSQKSNPMNPDRDGEYVTIAEVEKNFDHPIPPVTSAKNFPAFREMDYVCLNELTTNPVAQHLPSMQSSPASSLERNRRRQGARVTLDSEGKVVYSSDSLTRRWKNAKGAMSTFEPGPHVRPTSPTPTSPLPNRIPKTNIRPVNSTALYNIPPSKPAASRISPVTSPTRLGRHLIIRPGNQQQPPVVESVQPKAAVTALPGPVSPKLSHQGAYVNMQKRRELSGGGSPSPLRSPATGGSWLQPAHMHPMQKQSSTSPPHQQNTNPQISSSRIINHLSPALPQNHGNPSSFQPKAYWTLPTRRSHYDIQDSTPRSSTPNPSRNQIPEHHHLPHSINPPMSKTSTLSNQFYNKYPHVNPSSPVNLGQPQMTNPYCFKSPSSNDQPSHRWLIDSNHNVMHSAAPITSTPTSKTVNSLPRNFGGMSPIRSSSPTTRTGSEMNEIARKTFSTFSAQNEHPVNSRGSPTSNKKSKDIVQTPLFSTKSTMPSDEFFALIHRSKKKMNIRTDLDSPVRSGSPASHSSLSPGNSESSLTSGVQPPAGSRHSWSPPDTKPATNPPCNNSPRSAIGTRLSWAGNGNSTPPTSRTDFKRLLLQQRPGGGSRVSAAERLKVGKFGGSNSNDPTPNSIPHSFVNGSPRSVSLLPINAMGTPRGRIGAARRFASPRTDVLSSPIPEDKDGEEVGSDPKGLSKGRGQLPVDIRGDSTMGIRPNATNTIQNSLTDKQKSSRPAVNGFIRSPQLSNPSSILNKSPLTPSGVMNDHGSKTMNNHVAKSILHTPSPTLGALLSKRKKTSLSPDSSLGPTVKSILEAIQSSKSKSPSKLALETAL